MIALNIPFPLFLVFSMSILTAEVAQGVEASRKQGHLVDEASGKASQRMFKPIPEGWDGASPVRIEGMVV